MEHHQSSNNEWAERHRDALTTHHSHEDVLNDREFERLLEACRDLPAPRGFQARFICLLGGRLPEGVGPARRQQWGPSSAGKGDTFLSIIR